MTINELKQHLDKFDGNMEVIISFNATSEVKVGPSFIAPGVIQVVMLSFNKDKVQLHGVLADSIN